MCRFTFSMAWQKFLQEALMVRVRNTRFSAYSRRAYEFRLHAIEDVDTDRILKVGNAQGTAVIVSRLRLSRQSSTELSGHVVCA